MPILHEPETPRLLLRRWRDSDREPLARMHSDPRVMEHFPSPLSRAESDAVQAKCSRLLRERGWGFWAVEERASSLFIGFIGLHVPSATLPFSSCVEIGWRLAASHWGRGLASEGALAALGVGFERIGLPEIVSFTALTNERSQALMRRLGMRRDPEEFDHFDLPESSLLRRHCLYRMDRALWAAVRPAAGPEPAS